MFDVQFTINYMIYMTVFMLKDFIFLAQFCIKYLSQGVKVHNIEKDNWVKLV